MKTQIRAFLMLLLSMLVTQSCAGTNNTNLSIIDAEHRLYSESSALALDWLKALAVEDSGLLLEYALPEYKQSVKTGVENKDSKLFRYFYGSSNSVSKVLRSLVEQDYFLLAHNSNNKTYGISICYFDAEKNQLHTNIEKINFYNMSTKKHGYCQYFFKADGKWHASFELN